MNRYGWIAALLGLSLAGAAHAQQMDEPKTGQEAGTERKSETGKQAVERQSETDKQQQASDRLSRIEAQGIQLSALDEDQVEEVQRNLQELGYYNETVDGIAGNATKQALSRFYRDQAELASQGMILPAAATALGLEEAEIEPVSGEEPSDEPKQQQPPSSEPQQPQQPTQQPQQPTQQPQQPTQQPQQPTQQPQQPTQQPQQPTQQPPSAEPHEHEPPM